MLIKILLYYCNYLSLFIHDTFLFINSPFSFIILNLGAIFTTAKLSSGILSSIYYNDFFTIASDSIIYIIININNGWFIRILHVIGASLFILLILLHLIRAIWIKLKVITIKNLSFIIIITGYLLFILSMIEGFKTIWWSFIGFYVHS